MKSQSGRGTLRMIAVLALGVALGLGVGYLLFQSPGEDPTQADRQQAVDPESGPPERSPAGSSRPVAPIPSPAMLGAEKAADRESVADFTDTLTVPVESLARLPVPAFAPRRGNPWQNPQERFALTREVRDLLGIDQETADDIRESLEGMREEIMHEEWREPARIEDTENGVALSIAPAPVDARKRLSEILKKHLGRERANLLMGYSGETFDWEFGGFGRFERSLEVTVLPDDTLSIRESLRPVADPDLPHASVVEKRVNQYRIETLPPELERFVEVDDAP